MRNNNKGFSLIELLAVIIIIGIVALIAIPAVSQYIQKASDTSYESYERSIEDATKNYVMDCETNPNATCVMRCESSPRDTCKFRTPYKTSGLGSKVDIELSTLINEGYIEQMKDPESNDFCDQTNSYVRITLRKENTSDYEFHACLVCGDYTTIGC